MIRFRVERVVPTGPEEVYAWFSDYSDGDYVGPGFDPKEGMRRRVSAQDGARAMFTDHYAFVDLEYRADKQASTSIVATGTGKRMDGRVATTVLASPAGSTVVVEFEFAAKGGARLMATLMARHIEKVHVQHVDAFLNQFLAERQRSPAGAAR